MVRKANCLLATFPRVGPFILTHLFQSYCLSLYNSGPSYALLFRTLNLLSIRFSVESGVFLPVVTPTLFTKLPNCTVYSMWFIVVQFFTQNACHARNGACTNYCLLVSLSLSLAVRCCLASSGSPLPLELPLLLLLLLTFSTLVMEHC